MSNPEHMGQRFSWVGLDCVGLGWFGLVGLGFLYWLGPWGCDVWLFLNCLVVCRWTRRGVRLDSFAARMFQRSLWCFFWGRVNTLYPYDMFCATAEISLHLLLDLRTHMKLFVGVNVSGRP